MHIFGDRRVNMIVGTGVALLLGAAVANGVMSSRQMAAADPALPAAPLAPAKDRGAVPATQLGINLTDLNWWNKNRAFGNLLMGGSWQLKMPGKEFVWLGRQYRTADGGLKLLPQGAEAIRALGQPITGPQGVTIICTFDGKGRFNVIGASDVFLKGNSLSFKIVNERKQQNPVNLHIRQADQASEITNMDCREKNYDKAILFDPDFVKFVHQFKLIRFMDLQNTNANHPVTWATRKFPNNNTAVDSVGMSIEHMVALANAAQADAWFNMPWNASDDYVEGFAQYVHDHLGPNQTVYVELSNEVWNWAFPVAHQASKEGVAQNLSQDGFQALLFRYAEKSKQVLDIWNRVYKNDRTRLVRVVASQSVNPWTAEQILGHKDTYKSVDALAAAPYFGQDNCGPRTGNIENDLFKCLENNVKFTIDKSVENARVARKYGKRFVAYEAGQHLIMRDDTALLLKVSRDQRMYDLYRDYIRRWQAEVGDTMMLFASSSPVSQYGAWGLMEYPGQPASDTPKMRAVQDSGLLR